MELQETLRRRTMVRSFRQDPVDPAVLERIMATVLHAPGVGFVGLGHPAEADRGSAGSSAFSRRRRPLDEIVHHERW